MSGAWKQQEREVASWFGTFRNPLSGRNNRDDVGNVRLGDIILSSGVVEVKRRSTVSMTFGAETAALAKRYGKPWLVVEFKTGKADMVKLVMNKESAREVCGFLKRKWEGQNGMG